MHTLIALLHHGQSPAAAGAFNGQTHGLYCPLLRAGVSALGLELFLRKRLANLPPYRVATSFVALVGGGAAIQYALLKFSPGGSGAAVAQAMKGKEVDVKQPKPDEQALVRVVRKVMRSAGVNFPEQTAAWQHEDISETWPASTADGAGRAGKATTKPQPQVRVFIIPTPGMNAFAAGLSLDEAAIAVTQGLYDALNEDELTAVIGHEVGHLLHGDVRAGTHLAAMMMGFYCKCVCWLC